MAVKKTPKQTNDQAQYALVTAYGDWTPQWLLSLPATKQKEVAAAFQLARDNKRMIGIPYRRFPKLPRAKLTANPDICFFEPDGHGGK